jgi:hypothetical protein
MPDMNWYPTLRLVSLGRRAVRALERIAVAQESLATASAHVERPKPRPTEFGLFDLDAANEQWRKDRAAAGEDEEP